MGISFSFAVVVVLFLPFPPRSFPRWGKEGGRLEAGLRAPTRYAGGSPGVLCVPAVQARARFIVAAPVKGPAKLLRSP